MVHPAPWSVLQRRLLGQQVGLAHLVWGRGPDCAGQGDDQGGHTGQGRRRRGGHGGKAGRTQRLARLAACSLAPGISGAPSLAATIKSFSVRPPRSCVHRQAVTLFQLCGGKEGGRQMQQRLCALWVAPGTSPPLPALPQGANVAAPRVGVGPAAGRALSPAPAAASPKHHPGPPTAPTSIARSGWWPSSSATTPKRCSSSRPCAARGGRG